MISTYLGKIRANKSGKFFHFAELCQNKPISAGAHFLVSKAGNSHVMIEKHSQLINTLLIVIGGGLLMFEIWGEKENTLVLVLGLVMLMAGLYRATNHWVYTQDDHKEEDQDNKSE